MSWSVRDMLEWMMDINPETRITAEEILEHKWITDNEKLIKNIFYDPEHEEEEIWFGESKDSYLTTKLLWESKGKYINKEAYQAYFNTTNHGDDEPAHNWFPPYIPEH